MHVSVPAAPNSVIPADLDEMLAACYQCGKCSAGCPVAFAMDLLPHQVVRQCLYRSVDEVLASRTIWLCAACETCSTRCPNDVDIARVMDVMRQAALQSGRPVAEPGAALFHRVFLEEIERSGRVHELRLMQRYALQRGDTLRRLKSGELQNDLKLGIKMLLRGKITLWRTSCRGRAEISSLFNQARGRRR